MEGNGRRARAGRHEDLPDPIFKGPQGLLVDLRDGIMKTALSATTAPTRSEFTQNRLTTSSDGHESHGH